MRARSASYAHADYLFGAVLAFVVLLVILFVPFPFPEYFVPIDVALAFVIGSIISWRSNSVRRLFSTEKFRRKSVRISFMHDERPGIGEVQTPEEAGLESVGYQLKAGECGFHHALIWHASGREHEPRTRAAASSRATSRAGRSGSARCGSPTTTRTTS